MTGTACSPFFWTVLSGLLTPLIALIAGCIAYRQWRTAHHRLRLDLFDRRLAIHTAVRELIATLSISGTVEIRDFVQLIAGTRQARWLLDTSMQTYFDNEMIPKVSKLQSLASEFKGLKDVEGRVRNMKAQRELKEWIEQQRAVIDCRFDRFLSMPK